MQIYRAASDDEIETAFTMLVQKRIARRPIDRRLNLIAYWRDGTNIGGHRVEVVRREHLVKGKRHLRR